MGTAGAAAVTVTGQPAGGLPGIYLNIKGNKEFPVHFTLHIRKMYVVNIQKAGTPTAIVQGIMSVSFFVSPAGIISVSYTHLDVYKRQGNTGGRNSTDKQQCANHG